MSFIFEPLRKYADFKGRARRAEYWQFMVLQFLFFAPTALLVLFDPDRKGFSEDAVMNSLMSGPALLAMMAAFAVLFVPSLAVSIRRLHDTNRSGFWYLFSFVPVIGGPVNLVFMLLDGTAGENRFGPDPKGRDWPSHDYF